MLHVLPEVLHVLPEVLHVLAGRLPLGTFFLDLSEQRTVVVRQDLRVVRCRLPRAAIAAALSWYWR